MKIYIKIPPRQDYNIRSSTKKIKINKHRLYKLLFRQSTAVDELQTSINALSYITYISQSCERAGERVSHAINFQ